MTYSVDNGFKQTGQKNNEPRVGGIECNELVGCVRVPLSAVDTGGGLLSWQNEGANEVVVTRILVDVSTASSGACTADFGQTAVNATTSSDTLLDGIDLNSKTTYDNMDSTDQGTNGNYRIKVPAGQWITGSVASGASAGVVGDVYIYFTRGTL